MPLDGDLDDLGRTRIDSHRATGLGECIFDHRERDGLSEGGG